MSSKRLFTWSKRQSGAEPYYRTGGLLPIDMIDVDTSGSDSSNTLEPKVRVLPSCACQCQCVGKAPLRGCTQRVHLDNGQKHVQGACSPSEPSLHATIC
jgi:hypothetical protein